MKRATLTEIPFAVDEKYRVDYYDGEYWRCSYHRYWIGARYAKFAFEWID